MGIRSWRRAAALRTRLRSSKPRLALFLVVTIFASVLTQAPEVSKGTASGGSPLTQSEDYRADFSQGAAKGVGLLFSNVSTGLEVDLRLRGYPGKEASQHPRAAEFEVAPGIRVFYTVSGNQVKETVILDQSSPSELRFALKAEGLKARIERGEIMLSPPGQPWMFKIGKVVAWDRDRNAIPATVLLQDNQVVVRLDTVALAHARPPITIDPTIAGAPADATVGPQARKLFQTTDGRWVFFHRQILPEGPKFVYRVSLDQGETWGEPQAFADAGASGDVSAVMLQGDSFMVAYNGGNPSLPRIAFRQLIPQGPTWVNGVESTVSTAGVWWQPRISIADRGQGPFGRRLVAGFIGYNQALNRWNYITAFSENSGLSWTPGGACGEGGGIVAAQDGRAYCVTAPWEVTSFSEWDGAVWQSRPPIRGCCSGELPSITRDYDGTLHLVADEYSGAVYYSKLSPEAAQWAPVQWLGLGRAPVITMTGNTLHVFAYDPQSGKESLIRTWVRSDGANWVAGNTLGGRPFIYVLDHNQSWAFKDLPQEGDMLFSISNATGWTGNRIGVSRPLHPLDSALKKISFGFTPQSSGSVSEIKIWATATAAPSYRVGLQADTAGVPSGDWLIADQTGVPVFAEVAFTDADIASPKLVAVPSRFLSSATRYHVVVEPISPVGIGPANYAAIEAVGADPQATFAFDVRTSDGSSWQVAPAEVPRMVLSGSSGVVFSQEIIPRPWAYGAMEYVVTGESFVPSQNIAPTQFRLHLAKTGNPTAATIRLFDSSNTQLWSATANPASSGWVDLAVSGVTLSSGARYRLVVDHDSRDTANVWWLQPSGDATTSWQGTASALTSSHSRPGFSDRSGEASDFRTDAWFWDLVGFDSSATDALYLGDSQPFGLATMVRLVTDGGYAVPTSWSYWNGTSWAPLSLTSNDFMAAGLGGRSEWTTPNNWAQTAVDGKTAYWVKVTTSAGGPTPILVERTTGIRDLRSPSVPPRW